MQRIYTRTYKHNARRCKRNATQDILKSLAKCRSLQKIAYYYVLVLMFLHSTHSVLLMYCCSVLFTVYVTLPPGIGPIAVGNKYI
jgi:hypothetical protein